MADALSRRHNVLTLMQTSVPVFSYLVELYPTDAYFGRLLIEATTGVSKDFTLHDGFLFKGLRLCIPESSLRLKIIQELHNEGYVGRDRTLHLATSSYFWPSMRRDVAFCATVSRLPFFERQGV